MNKTAAGLLAVLGFAASACSTAAFGSAPAKDGSIYVVGMKAGMSAVWLCPATPGKGECKRVDVDEVSK